MTKQNAKLILAIAYITLMALIYIMPWAVVSVEVEHLQWSIGFSGILTGIVLIFIAVDALFELFKDN